MMEIDEANVSVCPMYVCGRVGGVCCLWKGKGSCCGACACARVCAGASVCVRVRARACVRELPQVLGAPRGRDRPRPPQPAAASPRRRRRALNSAVRPSRLARAVLWRPMAPSLCQALLCNNLRWKLPTQSVRIFCRPGSPS